MTNKERIKYLFRQVEEHIDKDQYLNAAYVLSVLSTLVLTMLSIKLKE